MFGYCMAAESTKNLYRRCQALSFNFYGVRLRTIVKVVSSDRSEAIPDEIRQTFSCLLAGLLYRCRPKARAASVIETSVVGRISEKFRIVRQAG